MKMSPFTFSSVGELPGALGVVLKANSLPCCDQGMMPVVVSRSGAGKTYTYVEFCRQLGIGFMGFNLNMMTEVDFMGVPTKGEHGFCEWMTMKFPFEDVCGDGKLFPQKGGLILFDEMDLAAPAVLQTIIPLISSHALNGRKISRDWHFCSAINGQTETGERCELMGALLKRSCFLYIDNPKPESVVEFGKSKAWDNDVLDWAHGHLGYTPYVYDDLRPSEVDGRGGFILPPRSLMFLSALSAAGKLLNAPDDLMLRLYQGVAGTEVAVSLMTGGDVGLREVLRDPMGCQLLSNPLAGISKIARELKGMKLTGGGAVAAVKTYIGRHRKELQGAMMEQASRECPVLVS